MANSITIADLSALWPIIVSTVAVVAGFVTFIVRYQSKTSLTDKRLSNVEARLLALEGQYHAIHLALAKISTYVEMIYSGKSRINDDE